MNKSKPTINHFAERHQDSELLANILWCAFRGEKLKADIVDYETGEILIPSGRKITKQCLKKVAKTYIIERVI